MRDTPVDFSIENTEWVTLHQLVGLPGFPATLPGVKSAYRAGRWKNIYKQKTSTGRTEKVFVNILELSDEARKELRKSPGKPHVDVLSVTVDDACDHIENFNRNLSDVMLPHIFLSALIQMCGKRSIQHHLKFLL